MEKEIYRIISINRIEKEINSLGAEEIREDWCRRNNWDGSAESCKRLKDRKPWPKWLFSK
jgi:hypothetical protein